MILFYDSQRSSQVSTVVEVSRDIFRVVDTVQKNLKLSCNTNSVACNWLQ